MDKPRYPLLYQINTRVYLTKLSRELGRPATLDESPSRTSTRSPDRDSTGSGSSASGRPATAARQVSRTNPEWRQEFQELLPDLTRRGHLRLLLRHHGLLGHEPISAATPRSLGSASGCSARGLRLHAGLRAQPHRARPSAGSTEHPTTTSTGTEEHLAREPQNYTRSTAAGGAGCSPTAAIPTFAGWPDTLQLNYGNPALQEAHARGAARDRGQCDGVRCDMAMLVLPDVFERTWGIAAGAVLAASDREGTRAEPDFLFMAEVYWDLEWTLQQQGFDYMLRQAALRPPA